MSFKKTAALALSIMILLSLMPSCFAAEEGALKPLLTDIVFDGYNNDNIDDIITKAAGATVLNVEEKTSGSEDKYLAVTGNVAYTAFNSVPENSKYLVVEYDYMQPTKIDGRRTTIGPDSNRINFINTSGGNIQVHYAATAAVLVENYSANTWYNFKFLVNFNTGEQKIYVNNIYKTTITGFITSGAVNTGVDRIQMYHDNCYDNIRVSAFAEADAPQAVIDAQVLLDENLSDYPQSARDYLKYKLEKVLNFTDASVQMEAEINELKALVTDLPNREIISGSGNERINDIVIDAPTQMVIPPEGEGVVNTASLSAVVKDQYNSLFSGSIKWAVDSKSTQGNINEDTGVLTITSEAEIGDIIVKAYDSENGLVCAVKKISLREGNWILKDGQEIVNGNDVIIKVKILPAQQLSDITLTVKNLSGSSIDLGAASTVSSDSSGKAEFSFSLDGSVYNTGNYPIEIQHPMADMNLSFDLYYVGDDLRATVLSAILSSTPDNLVSNVFSPYSDVLKIDIGSESLYNGLSDKSSVHNALAGKTFVNIPQAATTFNNAVAVQSFKEASADTMENILTQSNDIFMLMPDSDYSAYKESANQTLVKYSNTVSDVSGVKELFDKTILITKLNSATRNQIAGFVEESIDKLIGYGLNTTYNDADAELKRSAYITIFDKDYDLLSEYIAAMNFVLENPPLEEPESDSTNTNTTIQVPSYSNSSSGRGGGGGGASKEDKKDNKEEAVTESVITISFEDVSNDFWAYDEINALVQKGIINGRSSNCFAPDDNVTREEFLKMILISLDVGLTISDTEFEDVCSKEWYYPYVVTAQNKGIISGVGSNLFGIGSYITRQDAATILYRCVKALQLGSTALDGELSYSDKESIAPYALSGVEFAQKSAIMNGVGNGEFNPTGFTTRAMAAKIVYNALSSLKGGQQ